MVTTTTDHQQIAINEQLMILEATKEVYTETLHLCCLKDINEVGIRYVCVVGFQDKGKLVTAHSTIVQEGMVIYTNSPKACYARRCNVELLLFQHDCECAYCSRSGNCSLQEISDDLDITFLPYERKAMYTPWNQSFPLIRESNKCIKCMRCIQIYDKVQNPQVWDVQNIGSRTTVNVSLSRSIKEVKCSLYGQCITRCPMSTLHMCEDSGHAFATFNDPDKITIVQIAPAVRAVWGESPGLRREEVTIEKLEDAFRRVGADYVFDTGFVVGLAIMKEASEFLEQLRRNKEQEVPTFISRCPGWVCFLKSQHPDMVSHLSTSESLHQMFSAATKTWFAEKPGVGPSSIYNISAMPYVARRHEIDIPVISDFDYCDADVVLTTREVVRMVHTEHIDIDYLQGHLLNDLLRTASGAGTILGTTNGIMKAVLRSVCYFVTGGNADADAFVDARGMDDWGEFTFEIQGIPVRCAIISGFGNTHRLIEAMHRREVAYNFIGTMTYSGGCSGGGGQPIHDGEEFAVECVDTLYHLDRSAKLRYSHKNPSTHVSYDKYLGKPFLELVGKSLHIDHGAWQMSHTKR